MIYRFHVTVHARTSDVRPGLTIALAGRQLSTLELSQESLGRSALACSFEEAAARLSLLPRLYCEPDGSFVWVSPRDEPSWQVDGNLFDRAGRLAFVDLKGTCPPAAFDALLSALGWPDQRLVFQLTREALLLDEAEFRRWAAAE